MYLVVFGGVLYCVHAVGFFFFFSLFFLSVWVRAVPRANHCCGAHCALSSNWWYGVWTTSWWLQSGLVCLIWAVVSDGT